ncbi:hypothetical protein EA138_12815 [Anoxybacillus flavithermus]|uniref:Uncharacterized protein n=1 Tax=Anoxybacillus flavithermus TaxID=33934 RepID=A0AAX1ZY15_9BACL|nr:hypothetical protein EA138_12815 [Anoxybacillus flavithermus]
MSRLYHLTSWHGDKKSEQCHVKQNCNLYILKIRYISQRIKNCIHYIKLENIQKYITFFKILLNKSIPYSKFNNNLLIYSCKSYLFNKG